MALRSKPDSPLETYRQKRDFSVTSEPSPESKARKQGAGALFMVHKHDATRLHYDLRFEMHGALVSFACPKGPSYDPSEKRLAVQTEDHPLAYGDFEGRIPDGQYGAGDSIVWDRGTFETVPPGEEEAQLKKGRLHVKISAEKLVGEWHLVRTKMPGSKQSWLCIKAKDGTERKGYDVVAERPESVVSGKRVTRGPVRKKTLNGFHPKPETLLEKVWPPMLATLGKAGDTDDAEFFYEVKYDGFRAVCAISGGQVAMWSRNTLDFVGRFPWAAKALETLVVGEAVVDGELVTFDSKGVSSFGSLGAEGGEHRLVLFDLLWLEGEDLRARPAEERRTLLESLLAQAPEGISLSEVVPGTEAQAIEVAQKRGLEGVIAKRLGAPYTGARTRDWVKLKTVASDELPIIGWTPISNGKQEIGALLLGRRVKGELHFAGKVGTGFDAKTRRELLALLRPAQVDASPAVDAPKLRDAHWVKPEHLAQVQFMEWTGDGKLRHPSFLGLRDDKTPADASDGETVAITHPERVIFPKAKLTKADVRDYVEVVAPFVVKALADRPLSFQQFPRGIAAPGFFRHDASKAPEWVTRATVHHEERDVEHLVVDDERTLQWLANQSALTWHMTSSRLSSLESPDWMVFDLDPADDDFAPIVPIAQALHGMLDELKLESFPKTSGKRGLHVFVPLAPEHTHAQVLSFAEQVMGTLAKAFPEQVTTERSKAKRKGRLYLDALQNGRLKTMVSPYSMRAVEAASVSTPLEWDEVVPKFSPADFTIETLPRRLAKVGDLFEPVLRGKQKLPKL